MPRMRAHIVSVCLAGAVAGCAPEPRAVDVPVTPEAKRSESSESASTSDAHSTAPAGSSDRVPLDASAAWDDDAQSLYGKGDIALGPVFGGGSIGPGWGGLTGKGNFGIDGGLGVGSGLGPPPGMPPGGDGGGPLGTEPIRRVVMAHVGALRACYEMEAQKNPALAGKITLAWTIEPTGVVSKAAVASTTMHDERVEKCLVRQVQSWRFPQSGGSAAVSYPFTFGVAGDGGA